MQVIQKLFLLSILFIIEISSFEFDWVPGHHDYEMHNKHNTKNFINEWTVAMEGGDELAQLVALELGYEYGGPVQGFPNLYVFQAQDHTVERRAPSEHTSTLIKDRRIRWAEQLYMKTRVKRYPSLGPDVELRRVKRENVTGSKKNKNNGAYNQESSLFNDELWTYEWYLQDTRTGDSLPRLDLNVMPVYAMGYDGRGVRVSVLDDGIEHNHTDLRENYDPEISWDCNDRDSDPYPKHGKNYKNSHGTRCAGEIAMTANNKKCGVGVAWGARVGGVRMLDGRITDRVEGEAIGFAWEKVDIYSASWGPSDDGKTVEGPGRLALEALKRGITRGRNGKGTIYVWANGNGGGNYDNCNCDGYSSSIYTISIGSASQQGLFPWYGEICSSTLATAYSSGAYKDQKIATTDIHDSCTIGHTGTSAAAPLAAGIIALALQANPNLTWRDVQHLIVWTSEYSPLAENIGWQMNGIGLYFDVRFGFGLLNAGALVTAALNWTNVPEKKICRSLFGLQTPVRKRPTYEYYSNKFPAFYQKSETNGAICTYQANCNFKFKPNKSPIMTFVCTIPSIGQSKKEDGLISSKKIVTFKFELTKCEVNYIEHVELVANVQYNRRGALEIYLTSPQGTMVALMSPRPKDNSKYGFMNWPLTSVAMWGERPNGFWKITFQDETGEQNSGYVNPFTLIVHGTHETPEHMKQPRLYNNDYISTPQNLNGFVDTDFDDIALIISGEHSFEESTYEDLDKSLDQIGDELLREHHSKQGYKIIEIN